PAGPIDCLLLVVVGQNAKNDGYIRLNIQIFNALGHALANEVEMFGLSLNDASNGNYGIKIMPAHLQFFTSVDQFKTTGNIATEKLIFLQAVFQQHLPGADK